MTIHNILSRHVRKLPSLKGDIGLEIETETEREYTVPEFSFWEIHNDNSLRGFGVEYVLKQPLEFHKELPLALEEFKSKTNKINFTKDSITTSVHVHLNFLNDDFVTLSNFLVLYTLVENILVRYSGENRLSNCFCLPLCDAEDTYYNMLKMTSAISNKRWGSLSLSEEESKYAALNLSAFARRGSLEVRTFRGTTDTDLIYKWTSILYKLITFCRQSKMIPTDIITMYKDKGSEFLSDVFGEFRKELRRDDEDTLIEKNLWYALNVAYSVKDWNSVRDIPKPKKKTIKGVDAVAVRVYGEPFENLPFESQQDILAIMQEEENPPDEIPVLEITDPIPQRYQDFIERRYVPTPTGTTRIPGTATVTEGTWTNQPRGEEMRREYERMVRDLPTGITNERGERIV